MRKITLGYLLITAFAIFTFISCAKLQHVTITASKKQNEISLMPDLKEYLKENQKISVVLRVPNTQSTISREIQNTELYNQIERKLMNAGFNVIDRTLLENLVKHGNISYSDYSEIGKKLNADIIIELTDETWQIESAYQAFNKTKNRQIDLKSGKFGHPLYGTALGHYKPFAIYTSKFSFRIVLVKEGATRGYLTFYYTPCTTGCDVYANLYRGQDYHCCYEVKVKNPTYTFPSHTSYSVRNDYILEDLPNQIIKVLRSGY